MTQLLIAMLGGSAIVLALSDRRGLRLGWKSQNGKAIRWAKVVRFQRERGPMGVENG